ncbi:MAG: Transcriptional regulatory protein ZraR [Syntrophaceae bacterium PtaU1.Bin231]|nr:MAG: Transcriptional regulatory protein ZraR [Syntrophaceae bacterium PtaB.Bin038]OPY93157.1 MAG: Transcriptional regulatory protein ZraR [Syntrophaceae bacterium PtaU1.Bin231]
MGKSILLVDDDRLVRSFISTILKEDGHRVEEAESGRSGLEKFQGADFDLVVTDLRMPDLSGLDLIREGRKLRPESRWIIITAYGSIGNAVEAMKVGASDYLTKPFGSPEELRHVVRRVLREADQEQKLSLLSEELGKQYPPSELIFLGKTMGPVRRLVEEVAPTPATVLVAGPSGTGKELVARLIHQLSPRRDGPFVGVHCAALAETLLESELFGHERGAFTGATAMRKGRFELADGGTLFLDEIGDITPAIQVKLLRVLQEKQFERVGGNRAVPVDVRIISATHRDLRSAVAEGRFREDLYYRLNVFPIVLPSLKERSEAILPLAEYFAKKFGASFGKRIPGFTEDARNALTSYGWPGNIRELQNVIERAVILSAGVIDASLLNLETEADRRDLAEGLLKSSERELIRKTLEETDGNRRKAAEVLGISLRTLQYRIKEFGL